VNFVNEYYKNTYHKIQRLCCILILFCLIFIVPGCKTISPESKSSIEIQEQRLYKLKNISSQQCKAILTKLGFNDFPTINDTNSIIVTSTSDLLNRANIVVELIDAKEEYAIVNLGSFSNVRNLPSISRLASALGDINIGTFSQPSRKGEKFKSSYRYSWQSGNVLLIYLQGCKSCPVHFWDLILLVLDDFCPAKGFVSA
jgi:hypothetical protein